MKIKLNLLLISLSIINSCDSNLSEKSDRPNFIIFIADDISWDDFDVIEIVLFKHQILTNFHQRESYLATCI